MSEERDEQLPGNVIQVQFGKPRAQAPAPDSGPGDEPVELSSAVLPLRPHQQEKLSPYDDSQFPEDPMALKKLGVFKKFVQSGMVSVTLDPRARGVSVPARFADRHELVLNFSFKFFIDDFSFDDRAICASLSFSGRPFYCVVPWSAVKMLLCHNDNAVAMFQSDVLY